MSQIYDFLYSTLKIKTLVINHASVEIKDFADEIERVKNTGEIKTFFSDEFLCLDGYRAKLGVTIIKESDGSVFIGPHFYLVKGPYDNRLKWPFRGDMVFSCRRNDHSKPKSKTMSTINVSSKVMKNIFKKPDLQNTGQGFPQFLKEDKFVNYLINDTLKIELDVSEEKHS